MLPAILAAGSLIYGGKKLFNYLTSSADKPKIIEKKAASKKKQSKIVHAADSEHNKDIEIALTEKKITASLASMGLTATGNLFFPPMATLGIVGLGYVTALDIKDAYEVWITEKKVGIEVINSMVMIGMVASGYVFTAGFVSFVYLMGQKLLLEAESHNKQNLEGIFEDRQRSVWFIRDGSEVEIPMALLKKGDIISVRAGETIPVDGIVTAGNASADQQILTGESQPVEKSIGDQVFASTLLLAGRICIRVEKSGKDTMAANIEEILKKTVDFKTSVQSKGEKLSEKAILPTLALSAAALPIAGPIGSLAVLYSYVGYDIRIFAPLSMLNFMKVASENGILIKDGRAMELLHSVDTVVFDKTGTLTSGQPHVWQIHTCGGYEESEILQYAAIAENRQTHPIAKAILSKAEEYDFKDSDGDDVSYDIGYGIRVKIRDDLIRVGSARFMKAEGISIPYDIEKLMLGCHYQGYSLVMVAKNEFLAGAVELHSSVRPEAAAIIRKLRERNKNIYIISGDYEQVAKALAKELGIDNYFAEAFPEQKSDIIEQLQKEGKKVCFIGDGINDSIAMKKADVSVSLSGASQIATDTADIILMDGTLNNLDNVFDLAEDIDKNLQVAITSAIAPGVFNIGSVFFLNAGIVSAIVVNTAGLASGFINGLLPLLRYEKGLKKDRKMDRIN